METYVVYSIFAYLLIVFRCLSAEVDVYTSCVFNDVIGKCIHASWCSEPTSGSNFCGEQKGLHAFVCCPLKSFTPDGKNVGDNCTNNEVPGKCVTAPLCKQVQSAIADKRDHGLERCGFRKYDEVVCCPYEDGPEIFNRNIESNNQDSEEVLIRRSSKDSELYDPFFEEKSDHVYRKSEQACESYHILWSSQCLTTTIWNGKVVPDGEYPHMAAIKIQHGSGLRTVCGGSLISMKHVLTAAHCFMDSSGIRPESIQLGVTNTSDVSNTTVTMYTIQKYFIHPNYNRRSQYHDVAIIQLDREVITNDKTHKISPACLNSNGARPALNENLSVTGWGITENERTSEYGSETLMKTEVFIPNRENCSYQDSRRLSQGITDGLLCALGYKNSHGVRGDTCSGDSGGPLQSTDLHNQECSPVTVFGVISFGMISCGTDSPAYYTNVYKYLDWIENITWPGEIEYL